ncbi:triosephosphate isomerase (TIM) [Planctomycetaceae bacterium]|nr:triosephosphate isomerase (TIM) [Planctomycetaceae bacterium]
MRTPIIAGNWKMYKTIAEARELVNALRDDLARLAADGKVEIVLCPPFIALPEVAALVKGSPIRAGAQNVHWEAKGAFTGEIAPGMLNEICDYVIIGHSERRQYFGETDESVNKKIKAALAHHLKPIVCVGENLAQNEAGQTQAIVGAQVRAAFKDIARDDARGIVIAYEPIWAIGTGKAASGAGANAVIGLTIRGALADLYDEATAQAVRVQYGGSVNAKNAAEFLAQPDIDGALVGGASLVAADFIAICRAAIK